jgi:tRNA 2-thiocytidine biosynthesis protein TtcA
MSEITAEELGTLNTNEYQIVDIRSKENIAYGKITDSLEISEKEIYSTPPKNDGKKFIICCAKDESSLEVANFLCEKGYDAVSLKGGYTSWVIFDMSRQDAEEIRKKAEESLRKRFRTRIFNKFVNAICDYDLVKEGDSIAVCISGGKDSMLMAKLFQELKRHNKFPFEVKFLVMDPGYSPENRQIIEKNAKTLDIPINIFETNIFNSVYNVEKYPCYLCARMRRGYLYKFAKSLGCNKIALGHHYDDVIETILMGMLYGAQIQTMMPKLHSTNYEGMELIRPLYYIRENDIKLWRDYCELHFLQCACKFTSACANCENEEIKSKRLETKNLIKELKKTNPDIEAHIFRSVENVNLDTIIAYKQKGKKISFLENYDNRQQ